MLIAVELLIGIYTGFDLVLVGSILIIAGLLGNITNNLSLTILSAAILGFVYIAFGRQLVKSKIIIKTHSTNIDKLIGKTGHVLEKITSQSAGKVKIEDEIWRSRSEHTLEKGDRVTVKAVEGVTLIVEKNGKEV